MTTMPGMMLSAKSDQYPGVNEEKQRGNQRAHDGAGVIHRAVETVDAAAQVWRREVAEHGVAWRAANALAEPIDEAQGQHVVQELTSAPAADAPEIRSPEHDPLWRTCPVGKAAGGDLEDAIGGLRDTFDDAERHRACAQHARQEHREQRVNHLGRHVRDEITHPSSQTGRGRPSVEAKATGQSV